MSVFDVEDEIQRYATYRIASSCDRSIDGRIRPFEMDVSSCACVHDVVPLEGGFVAIAHDEAIEIRTVGGARRSWMRYGSLL